MLKRFSELLSWLIFAPQCLICKCDVFVDNNLCASCWNKLDFIAAPLCDSCGKPLEFEAFNKQPCSCANYKRHYRKVRSAFLFDQHSLPLIHTFKYNDDIKATSTMAKWMLYNGFALLQVADIIAPIPLHIKKLRSRKYNQALLLAQKLAGFDKTKLIPDLLVRTKTTISQSGLSKRKRDKNVRNAFMLNKRYDDVIRGKKIILIDDVITTGATVNECARVLKAYGAQYVDIITLAQTLLK